MAIDFPSIARWADSGNDLVGAIVLRSGDGPSVWLTLGRGCVYRALPLAVAQIVFLLAGFDLSFSQVQDNTPSTVHGTVVNAVTHDPVGRALVRSPDDRYATLTDSEGHFEFALPKAPPESGGYVVTGIPSGLFWLTARKPGFVDDPDGERQVRVRLGQDITIPLIPEGLIIGRVTFGSEVAGGVIVQLLRRQVENGMPRWMPQGGQRTNSKGEFRFAELAPGAYKLLTDEWMDRDPETFIPGGQLYGYPPVYYLNASDFSSAATIQLAAGQTLQADFSLVRHPYYPVKIPVVNAENGGLNITVSPQGQHGPGFSLGYNRGAATVVGQLPNGKYLIEANSYGPNAASGSVSIVIAGAPVEGPSLVLARDDSIPVNVKKEFTSTAEWPASGQISTGGRTFSRPRLRIDLNIFAEPADEASPRRGSGNLRNPTGPDDDSMVLENLAPGRYWLRITAQRGYVASAKMGGVDLLHEPLVVVPGATTPIDIVMRDDNAEIEGTLRGVNSSTAPATGTYGNGSSAPGYIYCIPLPDSAGQFLELTASPEGKFGDQMMAPGTYRALAFKSQQRNLPYRDAQAMKIYETKGLVVRLVPGQKTSVELEVLSSAE
jgi:hypothetical protein